MNGYFAYVSCLYHPEHADKPVVVSGDAEARHGIILSKNIHAKKYGIKTAETINEARDKCPNLVVLPAEYEKIKHISNKAHKIYSQYTDRVEPFSIDESWLDLGRYCSIKEGKELADKIRARIDTELGVNISAGVSTNKIFAKLGSDIAEPNSTVVIPPDSMEETVWPLPANELLGVGRATMKILALHNMFTIGDIARADVNYLKQLFGINGWKLWVCANGLDSSPVATDGDVMLIKSIGNSTTCPRDLLNDDDVRITMMILAESVAARLRSHELQGRVVQISIRDNELHSFSRQRTINQPTQLSTVILEGAYGLYKANYDWRMKNPIRSMGVRVTGLSSIHSPRQLSIFDEGYHISSGIPQLEKTAKLERTIDGLRDRYGNFIIRRGVLLTDPKLAHLDPQKDHTIHPIGYVMQ